MSIRQKGMEQEAAKEKRLIKDLFKSPMKPGQVWCLVDHSWFEQWKRYVHWEGDDDTPDTPRPGPMITSHLIDKHYGARLRSVPYPLEHPLPQMIKIGLKENVDYSVVPKLAFNRFNDWYLHSPPPFHLRHLLPKKTGMGRMQQG